MKLKNKKICITGVTSGIGLKLAIEMSNLENKIVGIANNKERINYIKNNYSDWEFYQCDLGSSEQINQLTIELTKKHPDIDILINNAGIQKKIDLQNQYEWNEDLQRELIINLHAPIQLTLELLPILASRPEACIVNVSSVLGIIPKSEFPLYCTSKAALSVFTKTLREQLKHTTIFVCELVPPLVNTPMNIDRAGNKMSVENLVEEAIHGLEASKTNILAGKTKIILPINRVLPQFAQKIINKTK